MDNDVNSSNRVLPASRAGTIDYMVGSYRLRGVHLLVVESNSSDTSRSAGSDLSTSPENHVPLTPTASI